MKVCFLLDRNSPTSLKTIFSRTFSLLEERGVQIQAFSPEVGGPPAWALSSPRETWPAPARTSRSLLMARTLSAYAIPLLLRDSCGSMGLEVLAENGSRWTYEA